MRQVRALVPRVGVRELLDVAAHVLVVARGEVGQRARVRVAVLAVRERRAARLALPEPPTQQGVGFLPPGPLEQTVVVDVEAIAQRVAELLEPRLVASVTASVVAALRSEGPVVVAGTPAVPAPPQALVGDDVPVFIPSKIGNALEADLELQATTATEGVVSDAAAALRAARKKQEPT